MIPKICQTPIVVDIQTHVKHVFGVIGVDVVSLQYGYCHHYDSNSFSDMIQFSVLQEASGTYVCYSSWSSSQFHVDILSCYHVHLYKYIYKCYPEEFLVYKTDVWYTVLLYLYIKLSLCMIITISCTIHLSCITHLCSTFPCHVLLFL